MAETQTKYTSEQIEEHCARTNLLLRNVPDNWHYRGLVATSLNIIRQLQGEAGVIAALRKTVAEQRTAIMQLQEELNSPIESGG